MTITCMGVRTTGNECPEDKYLNKFVRDKVCAACANNPELWRDLGIELMGQESAHILDVIRVNYSDVTRCCSEMFTLWRQRQPKANWNQLLRALLQIKLNTLADELDKLLLPSKEEEQQQRQQPQYIKQVKGDHKVQESDKGKYKAT